MAVLVNEHRACVDGIHQKLIRRREVALGFQVEARQALIVQHAFGGVVAIERDDVVIGCLRAGALPARCTRMPRTLTALGPSAKPATARQPISMSQRSRIYFYCNAQTGST